MIKRGDVYRVKIDPIEGSEIGKTKVYPFEVFLKKGIANISGDSKVKANQIRLDLK